MAEELSAEADEDGKRKEKRARVQRAANTAAIRADDWDQKLRRDSRPGGRLEAVIRRIHTHIDEGKTKPLDGACACDVDAIPSSRPEATGGR